MNTLHIRGLFLLLTFLSFSCIGMQPPPKKIKIERLPLPAIPSPIPPKKRNVMLSLRTLCGLKVNAPSFTKKYARFIKQLPADITTYLKWLKSVQEFPQHEVEKLFISRIIRGQSENTLIIDPEEIKTTLYFGANINAHCGEKPHNSFTHDYGYSGLPLSLAIRHNNPTLARALVNLGARVKITDVFGSTPLHTATEKDDAETVQLLLARKAPVNVQDRNGHTPLFIAARKRKKVISLLLAHITNINDAQPDKKSGSLIDTAIDQDDPELLQLLFQHGLRYIRSGWRTPLASAIQDQQIRVIPFLLAHGASIHEKIPIPSSIPSNYAAPYIPQYTTPLKLAEENYKKRPSEKSQQIYQLLQSYNQAPSNSNNN